MLLQTRSTRQGTHAIPFRTIWGRITAQKRMWTWTKVENTDNFSSVSNHYIIISVQLRWLSIVEKMLMTMITGMMSGSPGGVETIGRRLRPKVPDPSTRRPATTLLPCYCPPTLLLVSDPIWSDFFLSLFSQILVLEMNFLVIWWTFTKEFCVVNNLTSDNIFISKPPNHVEIDQYHRASL